MAHKLTIENRAEATELSWDAESALADAIAERSQFLEKNPQHREYQSEIDMILDKAGTSDNRMTVLAMLIEGKLIEMSQQFRKLSGIVVKMAA